jgi:hypothetical protein
LNELPIRHGEKVSQKSLALSIRMPSRWEAVEPSVDKLREAVEVEVFNFVKDAADSYRKRHEGPKLGSDSAPARAKT